MKHKNKDCGNLLATLMLKTSKQRYVQGSCSMQILLALARKSIISRYCHFYGTLRWNTSTKRRICEQCRVLFSRFFAQLTWNPSSGRHFVNRSFPRGHWLTMYKGRMW